MRVIFHTRRKHLSTTTNDSWGYWLQLRASLNHFETIHSNNNTNTTTNTNPEVSQRKMRANLMG